jgi:subtilase family serine protease
MKSGDPVSKSLAFRSAVVGTVALMTALGGLVLVPGATTQVAGFHAEPMSYADPTDNLTQPAGFSPAQIQAAYGLSTSPYAGTGETIAIVDAFDNPNVGADLSTFDTFWGLPACGTACFTKVDQSGGTNYPAPAPLSWSVEIALDVEWAHAIAPSAHILLVEADNDGLSALLVAEQYAGAHAKYVSNSWGYSEFSGETADAGDFSDPGVSYFAAVDDSAGKTQYPATSPNVVAVGGSELTPSGTIPWTSGGGGCSEYEKADSVEAGVSVQAGCSGNQSTPAVSADAVGIQIFDVATGWLSTGGTSFATILWAAAAADSGMVVTSQAVSSGSIPLHTVTGGTLLQTGFGDLGEIPRTDAETASMAFAGIEATMWNPARVSLLFPKDN